MVQFIEQEIQLSKTDKAAVAVFKKLESKWKVPVRCAFITAEEMQQKYRWHGRGGVVVCAKTNLPIIVMKTDARDATGTAEHEFSHLIVGLLNDFVLKNGEKAKAHGAEFALAQSAIRCARGQKRPYGVREYDVQDSRMRVVEEFLHVVPFLSRQPDAMHLAFQIAKLRSQIKRAEAKQRRREAMAALWRALVTWWRARFATVHKTVKA